jgi:arabinan endo-1,5-alpha-L-arabinosidase
MQKLLKIALLATSVFFLGARYSESPFNTRVALDHDFPDPGVVKADDGFYYAYSTQTITETLPHTLVNIQTARSKDLTHWDLLGEVMPTKPSWAKSTQFFWAPDVSLHDGTYYMYFSALPDTLEGFCLGAATSKSPRGPFVDSGQPLVCGKSYVNIDPMSFDDPVTGQRLLYWGSAFESIRARPLAKDRLHFEAGSTATPVLSPPDELDHDDYRRLLEGAWVVYHEGYYYLFASGDNCCGPTHYAVMVARSQKPLGPFEFHTSWKENLVLEADPDYLAPGHNAVIADAHGTPWILYHAIDRANPEMPNKITGDRTVRRVLKTQQMEWVDGWPKVLPHTREMSEVKTGPL